MVEQQYGCNGAVRRRRAAALLTLGDNRAGAARGCADSRGTSGSNPLSSSSQSVSAVNPEAESEKPRTLAVFCGRLGT
jgi:hypothetical protein